MAEESRRGKYKYSEPPITRHFDFPKDLNDELLKTSREKNKAAVSIVQEALKNYFATDGKPATVSVGIAQIKDVMREVLEESGPSSFGGIPVYRAEISDDDIRRIKVLAKPPCGPWKEAVEMADMMSISNEMAQLLDIGPADFLCCCDGESMNEAGIPDGALVLMRPLNGTRPAKGDVVLVQVETEDGEYVGTVKTWNGTSKGNPDLRDGKGHIYALPPNPKRVTAVAVKVGLIAKG